jgi:hypothetical protein
LCIEQTYVFVFQAVATCCRFLKLPGILSLGGQRTSNVLQRLSIIRDDIESNGANQFAWPKQHEFIHIESSLDMHEHERIASPINTKPKEKKKRN